jgi:hypothetical protein
MSACLGELALAVPDLGSILVLISRCQGAGEQMASMIGFTIVGLVVKTIANR